MVQAILDIDSAVAAWATDTEEDEGTEWARAVLRSLVVRLGEAASRGLRDPRDALAPAVDPLIAVRAELRHQGVYRLADAIRDALAAAGVEIRDTPQSTRWHLARDPRVDPEEPPEPES